MNGSRLEWVIRPGRLTSGAVSLPGDKSITHRAFLLAALAEGDSRIHGANAGADAEATLRACEALGAGVRREGTAFTIRGTAGRLREPADILDCGNSGTSLRLLAGLLAGQPLWAVLSGDASLRRRPVDRVIAPLRAMGATLSARAGDRLPPLSVRGGELEGTEFREPTGSAQVATAILFAGLSARGETAVATRPGVRDHSVHLMRAFGLTLDTGAGADGGRVTRIRGGQLPRAAAVAIPGDPSAAAFFLAAAAATPGARVTAAGINLNPTRLGFLELLRAMGAGIEIARKPEAAGEPVGDVTIEGPARLSAADVPAAAVPSLVDEVPAWAVVAASAEGVSRIRGAGELRVKESDRLRTLALNLKSLGIEAEEFEDGLAIAGGRPAGGTIAAGGDHRIAMAFAILGTLAGGVVVVDDARGVATSFPAFASAFRSLGGRLEEHERPDPATGAGAGKDPTA